MIVNVCVIICALVASLPFIDFQSFIEIYSRMNLIVNENTNFKVNSDENFNVSKYKSFNVNSDMDFNVNENTGFSAAKQFISNFNEYNSGER